MLRGPLPPVNLMSSVTPGCFDTVATSHWLTLKLSGRPEAHQSARNPAFAVEQGWWQSHPVHLEFRQELRSDTHRLERSNHASPIHAGLIEGKDVLQNDDVAFHSLDL